MALVREDDAFGAAGGAGGVEEHGRGVRRRLHRGEGAGVEEGVEAGLAEDEGGDALGAERQAGGVAERELGVAVAQDVFDRLGLQLEVDRDGDHSGPHGAQEGCQIFGAVGRKDSDAVARLQATAEQAAGDGVRHGVELGVAEGAGRGFGAEVDQRDAGRVAGALDGVAEVAGRQGQAVRHGVSAGSSDRDGGCGGDKPARARRCQPCSGADPVRRGAG